MTVPDWLKTLLGGGTLTAALSAAKSVHDRKVLEKKEKADREDHKEEFEIVREDKNGQYERSQALMELKTLSDSAVSIATAAQAQCEASDKKVEALTRMHEALERDCKQRDADQTKNLDELRSLLHEKTAELNTYKHSQAIKLGLKDRRIAELTAEVAKLRAEIFEIQQQSDQNSLILSPYSAIRDGVDEILSTDI